MDWTVSCCLTWPFTSCHEPPLETCITENSSILNIITYILYVCKQVCFLHWLQNILYIQIVIYFIDGYLTGNGVDYDSGTYNVKFKKGSKLASFSFNITKDNVFEKEEKFYLIITVTVPSSSTHRVFRSEPHTATVTIVDTACKYVRNNLCDMRTYTYSMMYLCSMITLLLLPCVCVCSYMFCSLIFNPYPLLEM